MTTPTRWPPCGIGSASCSRSTPPPRRTSSTRRLLDIGTGATDADDAEEETEDAITDHNDIRDGIAAAAEHEVGSDGWWDGVVQTRESNSDHMGEEERQALADFRQHSDLDERHRLGVQFARYEAEHAGGIDAEDRDPDEYLARNG